MGVYSYGTDWNKDNLLIINIKPRSKPWNRLEQIGTSWNKNDLSVPRCSIKTGLVPRFGTKLKH